MTDHYAAIANMMSSEMMQYWADNEAKILAQDKRAKERQSMVGRVIMHPYADGQAVYEITRVNKRTVRIRVVTGIGDDWVLPAWGAETLIPFDTAVEFLQRRDFWLNREVKNEQPI